MVRKNTSSKPTIRTIAALSVLVSAALVATVVVVALPNALPNADATQQAGSSQYATLVDSSAAGETAESQSSSVGGMYQPEGSADDASMPSKEEMEAYMSKEERALAEYEGQLAPYKKTVSIGETCSLANLDDAKITITNSYTGDKIETNVPKFVSWTGTLEASVDDATLYGTLAEAQAACDLGVVFYENPPEAIESPLLLVMHVTVTNVDATPGVDVATVWDYFSIDAFRPVYRGDIAMMGGNLATFDGAPEGLDPQSPYSNDYSLAQGETRTLTIGWWVDGSRDLSDIILRPSLSASMPGPVIFELGLDSDGVSSGTSSDGGSHGSAD